MNDSNRLEREHLDFPASITKSGSFKSSIATGGRLLVAILGLMVFSISTHANNIQVTNVALTGQNAAQGYWLVQFDLNWENSWRTDNLFPVDGHNVGNWDAAWVFVKYRVGNGEWQHAKLHYSGHNIGIGTPATLRIGAPNEREAFHSTNNPGVGVLIYRSQNGSGTFSTTGNQLRWNYAVDDVPNSAELDIRVFAIEMVYVAPGAFWLGDGETELGRFIEGGTNNNPFFVTESWNGCIENTSGCLWGTSTSDHSTIGGTGSLQEHYPTGLEGFYSMKYSISQQQYVDFLNTLTPSQASTRAYTGGGWRNGISFIDGQYVTSNPYVANNLMSWMDGAAYLDWSGLRPMTELEYEKAARGPVAPVANEYAWGSTSITQATGLINAGDVNEITTPAEANVNYQNFNNQDLNGPVRVGSFAYGSTNRVQSGASYWGIMELSGNLWERSVTVGNGIGRGFTGLHGSGLLTSSGNGDVESWPGRGSAGITGAAGSGIRGGAWNNAPTVLRVSQRLAAADSINSHRNSGIGIRGVRSLPVAEIPEPDTYTLNLEASPSQGGSVSGAGLYAEGSEIAITATANAGYDFVNWTGDTSHIENADDPNTTVTMPASNITLTANFEEEQNGTIVVDVTNPATGRTWMDRNLGASRAATSSTDSEAYGDLYQLGRAADGHQKRDSPTTTTLSSSDQPGHGSFILAPDSPYDWRSPQNDNLWQGVNGTNNPCPAGYRLPTEAEWNAERESWSSNNAAGAFNFPLKLPMAGNRYYSDGSLDGVGSYGYYWSSTVSGSFARGLFFDSSLAGMASGHRAGGVSVRCLRDHEASDPDTYAISLQSSPSEGGSVSGGGDYAEGAEITITATANEGYVFVNWSGDTDYIADGNAGSTTVTMPAYDMSLTANFEEEQNGTIVVDVTNPATGRTWMDRNLGASRAATSSTDSEAYGDLYQWGRGSDGHEKRNSPTTTTLSSSDQPGHGSFILAPDYPWDWRSSQNDNLWQGVNGTNNPCPAGYRLPTEAEWNAERESWSSNNAAGAFGSPLKLPLAGHRSVSSGALINVGTGGLYWSASVSGSAARRLGFGSSSAGMFSLGRAFGFSVRCLKE